MGPVLRFLFTMLVRSTYSSRNNFNEIDIVPREILRRIGCIIREEDHLVQFEFVRMRESLRVIFNLAIIVLSKVEYRLKINPLKFQWYFLLFVKLKRGSKFFNYKISCCNWDEWNIKDRDCESNSRILLKINYYYSTKNTLYF